LSSLVIVVALIAMCVSWIVAGDRVHPTDEHAGTGALGIAIGGFVVCGAVLDWNWFFKNSRARPVVFWLGRRGARVFYAILGGAFAGIGSAHL
jgi:hypothetical protein